MRALKQSVAANVTLKLYLSSDHVSAATGKTLTVTLSKDGGAFSAAGAAVTELSSGWYKVALTTTDTNTLGDLAIRATAADCDDAERLVEVVAYDPQSASNLGLSNLDAAITSRMATFTYTAPDSAAAIAAAVWAAGTRTLTSFGTLISDIWAAITDSAGVTTLLSRLTSGRAANLDNLDAQVSSRLATSGYTAAPTADQNADALLKRDWTAVTGEAARSVLNALRAIRNKVTRSGSTITVTKEDDTTAAYTAAITTSSSAEAITSVDPT